MLLHKLPLNKERAWKCPGSFCISIFYLTINPKHIKLGIHLLLT